MYLLAFFCHTASAAGVDFSTFDKLADAPRPMQALANSVEVEGVVAPPPPADDLSTTFTALELKNAAVRTQCAGYAYVLSDDLVKAQHKTNSAKAKSAAVAGLITLVGGGIAGISAQGDNKTLTTITASASAFSGGLGAAIAVFTDPGEEIVTATTNKILAINTELSAIDGIMVAGWTEDKTKMVQVLNHLSTLEGTCR